MENIKISHFWKNIFSVKSHNGAPLCSSGQIGKRARQLDPGSATEYGNADHGQGSQ